jgi:hypothetical protein
VDADPHLDRAFRTLVGRRGDDLDRAANRATGRREDHIEAVALGPDLGAVVAPDDRADERAVRLKEIPRRGIALAWTKSV